MKKAKESRKTAKRKDKEDEEVAAAKKAKDDKAARVRANALENLWLMKNVHGPKVAGPKIDKGKGHEDPKPSVPAGGSTPKVISPQVSIFFCFVSSLY